jgi:hypothetical protein
MRIHLSEQAVEKLEALMKRTGYTNPTHCVNVMISSVTNNLRRADLKKKAASI